MSNVRNINESSFKEKFEAYIFFLNDINKYHKKKDFLSNFPDKYKKILDEIKIKTNIYNLVRKNNIINLKKKETQNIIKNDNLIKFEIKDKTDEEIEKELLKQKKKNISISNLLSFGQYNINSSLLFFDWKNEKNILSNLIKENIKKIILECLSNIQFDKNKNKINKIKKYGLLNLNSIEKRKINKPIHKNLRIDNPCKNSFINYAIYKSNKNIFKMNNNPSKEIIAIHYQNKFKSNKPKKYYSLNNSINRTSKSLKKEKNTVLNTITNSWKTLLEDSNYLKTHFLNSIKPKSQRIYKYNNNTHRNFFSLKKNNSNNIVKTTRSSFLGLRHHKLKLLNKDILDNSMEMIKDEEDKIKKVKLTFKYNYNSLLQLRSTKLVSLHKNKKVRINLIPKDFE